MSPGRRAPGAIRTGRAAPADSRAGAADAGKVSVAGSLGGRGRGVKDQGSLRRGDIQLVTTTGEKCSRGEAGVRWSRVSAARARIAAGFYGRADVREKLLDAILDELTDP